MQLRGTAIVVDTVSSKVPVISGSGATRTLNETESGSTVLFDRAAGIVYTLPASKPGIYFDFITANTITSNAAKVIMNIVASSPVFVGSVQIKDGSDVITSYTPGATDIAISSNGTTTGGVGGSRFRVTCLSSSSWHITGVINGTGSISTPFATS